MASIFKPRGKSKYVILYHDKNGHRRKKTGATDKQVTERIARDLENRIILLKEGTIDPKAEAYRDHEVKPLAAHRVDFEAALVARGNTRNHCVATVSRIKKVLSLAKFKLVSDLSVSGAQRDSNIANPRLQSADPQSPHSSDERILSLASQGRPLPRTPLGLPGNH